MTPEDIKKLRELLAKFDHNVNDDEVVKAIGAIIFTFGVPFKQFEILMEFSYKTGNMQLAITVPYLQDICKRNSYKNVDELCHYFNKKRVVLHNLMKQIIGKNPPKE